MASIEALNGRISQYTPASRTRRAISCVYCDPKSSIITVSCCGTLLKKTSAPDFVNVDKRVTDYTQTRFDRKKLILLCAFASLREINFEPLIKQICSKVTKEKRPAMDCLLLALSTIFIFSETAYPDVL